jgi:hypothetical protein
MFKLISDVVGFTEEQRWPAMQIVEHMIVPGKDYETWFLAHQDGKLYCGCRKGIMSKDEIDRADPSLWRDPETCLPPMKELNLANFYPEVHDRFPIFYPLASQGSGEKEVHKEQVTCLLSDERSLHDALNTKYIAASTVTEIDALQILGPHPNIVKFLGVETTRALEFKYRNKTIKVPLNEERVLNLVYENYGCDLSYAIYRGWPVDVQACLDSVEAGIKHMHFRGLIHGSIGNPASILVKLRETVNGPVPTQYAIRNFKNTQCRGKVAGRGRYWSPAKMEYSATVEEDEDWFGFNELRKTLLEHADKVKTRKKRE